MRFCIYSRKSKATLKGDSIGNQIDMGRRYVLERYPDATSDDIDVYEDDGFSGKNTRRPAFTRMMERIQQGEYAYLIVYRLDRISRSVGDFADILKILERTNTQFVSLNEQFDTSSIMGRAMMSIASVFAQMERETISERVTDNMLLLSHTGRWLGGRTPAGFRSVRVSADPASGVPKAYSMLQEDEEEMAAVRLAFDLYLREGTLRGAIQAFYQAQARIRGSRQLSDFSLKGMLSNPVYCIADQDAYDYFYDLGCTMPRDREDFSGEYGCMPYNRHNLKPGRSALRNPGEWVIAIGRHRGVLPGKSWIAIQRRLQTNAALHPREQAARNHYALLTGMLVCKRCGARMYTQPQNSGRGKRRDSGSFTYMCERRKTLGKAACDCPSVSGKNLDAVVREALAQFRSEDSALAQRLSAMQHIQPRALEGELVAQQAQVARLEKKMYALIDRLADPDLPQGVIDYIKLQTRQLSAQITQGKEKAARLQQAEERADQAQKGYERVLAMLESFQESYGSLSIPEQRDILRSVVDRIEWDGESADIFPLGR